MVIKIQQSQAVSRRRALQILDGRSEVPEEEVPESVCYFACKMSEEAKRRRSPWKLEKHFQQILGEKTKNFRSGAKETYIVEVEWMHRKMKEIGKIGETEVQISEHTSINNSKGIVYVMQHDMTNFA